MIEVKRAAVAKENLDTSGARAHTVAGKQRHAPRGFVGFTVAFENDGPIDE
jgi:hypothetical protein